MNRSKAWFIVVVVFVSIASFISGYFLGPQWHPTIRIDTEWTNIAQTFIQALGLISLLFIWQERLNTNKWNRLRETLNLTWTTPYNRLRERIIQLERNGSIKRRWKTMSGKHLQEIVLNEGAKQDIRDFLDHLEEICAAYKLKVFDEKYFKSIWSAIMAKNYIYFKPFIQHQQKELEQDDLYSDLKEVYENIYSGKKLKALRRKKKKKDLSESTRFDAENNN